jgi:glucose-6-phosphate 1-dehydrogenase
VDDDIEQFPSRLVLFGATGDLAARYLFPALAALAAARLLPEPFHIVGVGSRDRPDDEFRTRVEEALTEAGVDAGVAERLVANVHYEGADVTDSGAVKEALTSVPGEGPVIAYLALPPSTYAAALQAIAEAGMPAGSRVVIEKPFGEGLASARDLNALLAQHFDEQAVFRVDHFIAKTTIQNILGLRFANRVFEPLWSNQHIERVEIVFDETLALEGRASYYDDAGALVDMIQNHLLQLLCLVAMDPPATLDGEDLRDRKVSVLRAIETPTADDAARTTIRGRYRGYAEEEGVDPTKETETFAQVTFHVDSWRWAGVPFVLRSGKALGRDRQEIAVFFRRVPHLAFGQQEQPVQNVLRLRLDVSPERLQLCLNANGGDDIFDLAPLTLDGELAAAELPAYAHVFLGVLRGDATLSIRGDEAEEAWRVIEPIRAAWRGEGSLSGSARRGRVPLVEYDPGSEGPTPAS